MSESKGEEFSWSRAEEEGSVVVRSVDAIAIYRNPSGDVVIRQESPMGEDDSVIVIPQTYLEGFIAALRNID